MLTFGSGDFGIRDELALVVIDHDSILYLYQSEILGTLYDETH